MYMYEVFKFFTRQNLSLRSRFTVTYTLSQFKLCSYFQLFDVCYKMYLIGYNESALINSEMLYQFKLSQVTMLLYYFVIIYGKLTDLQLYER